MKKLLTVIAAAILLICPSICFSSYIIHLKDGRDFATDRYWEEGDLIKFKRYGGVIGLQKDQVSEIEEIEDVPEEKAEEVKPVMPLEAEKANDVKKAEVPETAEKTKTTEDVVVKEKGAEDKSEQEKATGKEKDRYCALREGKKSSEKKIFRGAQ